MRDGTARDRRRVVLQGVGQSFEEAARWYERAAGRGFAYAQVNLGNMYAEGRGVARDLHRARELYAAAAAANDPHARVLLLEVEDEIKRQS
jgi:TPR repeat protein